MSQRQPRSAGDGTAEAVHELADESTDLAAAAPRATTPVDDALRAGKDREEPHEDSVAARLNWLRAGVLGANDGIVSTAGVVVGVAGATTSRAAIIVAGIAALSAGALSMAAGEYVSVSTQRDTERALIALEKRELHEDPDGELEELTQLYQAKGISRALAEQVAAELTDHDALTAHAEAELGIDPSDLTNPWHAAAASMLAFFVGALLPLLTIAFSPEPARLWVTVASVVAALVLTGWASARLGRAPVGRAVARNVVGGLVAMGVTYGIGSLVGVHVG